MARQHKAPPILERYVSIPVSVWDELRRRVASPEPNATTLYVYAWTGPETSRVPGVTARGRAALSEAIGWDLDAFMSAFASLESSGLAIADWNARIVYLPEALQEECSRPRSPSECVMWRREVVALPPCDLKDRIDADVRALLANMGSAAFLDSYLAGARIESTKPTTTPKSAKAPKSKEPPEPMPFTVKVALETLGASSKGAILTEPFDPKLAPRVTELIREYPLIGDWQLVGEHAAAGSFSWMKGDDKPGVAHFCAAGKFADAIAKARNWVTGGRRQGQRSGRPEQLSTFETTGQEDF